MEVDDPELSYIIVDRPDGDLGQTRSRSRIPSMWHFKGRVSWYYRINIKTMVGQPPTAAGIEAVSNP
jgi:hypothetical protein